MQAEPQSLSPSSPDLKLKAKYKTQITRLGVATNSPESFFINLSTTIMHPKAVFQSIITRPYVAPQILNPKTLNP